MNIHITITLGPTTKQVAAEIPPDAWKRMGDKDKRCEIIARAVELAYQLVGEVRDE